MSQNMRKDYLWNSTGVLLQNAISPLLLVVITRVNGIYDSGIFSFAFSVAVIFWAIGMWGGRTYQVSDVKSEFSFSNYITVRLVTTLLMIVGAVAFTYSNGYDETKSLTILLLVVFKAVESVADALYGVMQSHGVLYRSGKSLVAKAIVGFTIFTLIDLATKSIVLASLGILLVNVVIMIVYDMRVVGKFMDLASLPHELPDNTKKALAIMRRCSTVFMISLLAMFSLNIPRYFIDHYHPEELGRFGILAMPVTLTVLVVTFILQPKIVNLALLLKKRSYMLLRREVALIVLVTGLIGIGVLLITWIVGVPLLDLIFAVKFDEYKLPLMILIVGAIANAIVGIFVNILTIMRRFKAQLHVLLWTNAALGVASAMVVEKYSLTGAMVLFTAIGIIQAASLYAIYKLTLKGPMYAK